MGSKLGSSLSTRANASINRIGRGILPIGSVGIIGNYRRHAFRENIWVSQPGKYQFQIPRAQWVNVIPERPIRADLGVFTFEAGLTIRPES
jgi:hypothetical protein